MFSSPFASFYMTGATQWLLIGALLSYLLARRSNSSLAKIPIVRYSIYLPDIINRLIFYPLGWSIIQSGYEKYKDTPFRVLTSDGEVVVLPTKYLKEVKNLPPSIISSLEAQYQVNYPVESFLVGSASVWVQHFPNESSSQNALGDYTNIVISSYLPSTTIRKRLTPSLSRVIPWVIDELQDAFDAAMPKCNEVWTPLEAHQIFVHLIARATSRVAAGDALRNNKEWLDTASSYSVNIGLTIMLLRPFPNFLRPFVAPFLPPVRQMKRQVQHVKQIFVPMITQRREAEAKNELSYQKSDDLLQWMMDGVETEADFEPGMLAHHMLLLMSLAIIHTSSLAMTQILFDLIARPEYLEPLREEIQVTMQSGWKNATKASLDAQRRMDSFMRESQRFNPPGDLSMHRIVMTPLALSDGLLLPEGTHICFPSGPMTRDPSWVANPAAFDGFRWCKDPMDRNTPSLTRANCNRDTEAGCSTNTSNKKPHPESSQLASATATSYISLNPATMHFGYGRQACPGRFFAACMIKAILSRMLMEYDFKFEGNDQAGWRPANIYVGEHILPNTYTTVLFRKRQSQAISSAGS